MTSNFIPAASPGYQPAGGGIQQPIEETEVCSTDAFLFGGADCGESAHNVMTSKGGFETRPYGNINGGSMFQDISTQQFLMAGISIVVVIAAMITIHNCKPRRRR